MEATTTHLVAPEGYSYEQYFADALRTEASLSEVLPAWSAQAETAGLVLSGGRLLHVLAGYADERYELEFDHGPDDFEGVIEELGDLCWYTAILVDEVRLGRSDDDVDLSIFAYPLERVDGTRASMYHAIDWHLRHVAPIVKSYAFYGRTYYEFGGVKYPNICSILHILAYSLVVALDHCLQRHTEHLAEPVGIDYVMMRNAAKLKKRYPGKFSQDDANRRADKDA